MTYWTYWTQASRDSNRKLGSRPGQHANRIRFPKNVEPEKKQNVDKSLSERITVPLPVLHPGQELVKASRQRFNVLACGRRWGKTLFACLGIAADEAAFKQQR